MLSADATEADLVEAFNSVLGRIVSGDLECCPSDTGIDDQTAAVLDALGGQPMPKRARDIMACRVEFGRQLDGTHEREQSWPTLT